MISIKGTVSRIGVRKIMIGSSGRKPDLHWVLLFTMFLVLVLAAIAGNAAIFWWGTDAVGEEDATGGSERSFSKQQFEKVLDYYDVRKARFDAAMTAVPPVDPS